MLVLIWRELKTGTTPTLLISYLLGPTVYLLFFGLTVSQTLSEHVVYKGRFFNYLVFVTAGIMALQTLVMFNQAFAITRLDIVTNFFTVLLTSNISPYKYVFARILTYTSIVITQALYLTVLTYILTGYLPPLFNFFIMTFFLIMGLLVWFSFGTICALYIRNELTWDIVMLLVTTPSIFASSTLYSLDDAPFLIKLIGLVNPLTYTSDLVRGGYLQLQIDLIESIILTVIAICTLLLMIHSLKHFSIK